MKSLKQIIIETIVCGQCFEYAIKKAKELGNHAKIAQGIIFHPWDKKEIEHAWVEYNGKVYDWQNQGSEPKTIKDFYNIWKPKNIKKFSLEQAQVNMLKTGHYGPW